jgi:CheY-like chemotaxis protein
MNSLLLYNNNISPDFVQDFKDSIGETKLFSITNQSLAKEDYSFDLIASEFLKTLPDKKYDVIFIPINLSIDNYLEFSGLRIGYHIRLTNEYINQESPIVFIARESSFEINKLSFLGEIFSSPQIYLTNKLKIEFLTKQIELIRSTSKENVLKGFLNRIQIKPSGNYTTHHSIANEWSIIRWSKALKSSGILAEFPGEIETIEKKIESNLYYKYLTCKFPIECNVSINLSDLKLKHDGKILYIDDESDKGWNVLFHSLFCNELINQVENFQTLGPEFHGLEKDKIIKLSVDKAKDFDLILLDFRLTQDDFYETDPKKITGFQILEKIKEFNKGIQVIIFSASNKIWNLQALQEAGADGFIVKESPENSADNQFTFESISNLKITVNQCLNRSNYLKSMFEITNTIKEYFNNNKELEFDNESKQMVYHFSKFQLDVINELDIAFFLIDRTNLFENQKSTNQNLINHSYTSLYKILEYLYNYEIQGKIKLQSYDNNLKRFIPYNKDKHSEIQSGIITYIATKLNYDPFSYNRKLKDFRDKRNGVTHPKGKKPDEKDCLDILNMLKSVIIKKNNHATNS